MAPWQETAVNCALSYGLMPLLVQFTLIADLTQPLLYGQIVISMPRAPSHSHTGR
jgi:hypothetical protein